METKNVCPHCGGTEFYTAEDDGGYVRFVCCEKCHATGPTFDIPTDSLEDDPEDKALTARAIHAFCHPSHLMEGKVMVPKDDAVEAATTICALCHKAGICPGARSIPTTLCIVSRLCAAIEAAKREGR